MKCIKIFLLLLLFSQWVHAQSDVFVLVDVSRSVIKSDMNNARQALLDVLSGNPLSNASVSYGDQSQLVKCKLSPGDKLYIIKFGDKPTTLSNYPPPGTIQNIPADINQQVNTFFPGFPTDNKTYLTLAKAKVVEFAKKNQISIYRLCVITDNILDDYGPNGMPNYTSYERELTQSVGTTTNPVLAAPSTKLRLSNLVNQDYVLEFIPSVNVSNTIVPSNPPTVTNQSAVTSTPVNSAEPAQIKMTTNAGGRKNKEIELKDDNLSVSWSCSNYPAGGKYTVVISSYEGEKFKEVRKDLYSGFNIKLKDGKFKVSVMAENFEATSATTYVEVSSGGSFWILGLIAVIVVLILAYKFLKKNQEKKNYPVADKSPDLFPKRSGDSNSSSNSINF